MDTIMKRRRHTPEQAVRKIREGERLLSEGQDLVEVLRHLEVSEATFNRWRAVYGGMKADEAKRLKTLEAENQRLKKLVAEQALDIDMLKELAEGKDVGSGSYVRVWEHREPGPWLIRAIDTRACRSRSARARAAGGLS